MRRLLRSIQVAAMLTAMQIARSVRADPPQPVARPDLGLGASLHGKYVFPAGNAWNRDVSSDPIDPNSAAILKSIGLDKPLHPDFGTAIHGVPNGIPYTVVSATQPAVPIRFTAYGDESDPGPYPIPPSTVVEGGNASDGDRHIIVIDRDLWKLYEMDNAHAQGNVWACDSGAIFDLATGKSRPLHWTSADAAGLPIFPGLVRYDEVFEQKAIRHALRFTVAHTRRAFVAPAVHFASRSEDASLPPMGMRVRLRSDFDLKPFPPEDQVILLALQHYGMILADNGSDWFVSGSPDPRWNDDHLHALSRVKGKDFEVVQMGPLTTR